MSPSRGGSKATQKFEWVLLAAARGGPGGGQEGFEFSFFFPFSLFPETYPHMLFEQMSATLEQKRILRKTHVAFKVSVHCKMILSVF